MKCASCGKELSPEQPIVYDEAIPFCNAICRYAWRTNGKPAYQTEPVRVAPTNDDFIFKLVIDGFERRELILEASYWSGHKLFLDNKKVKRTESKYFKRQKIYYLVDNFGIKREVIVQQRFLDAIPMVKVDGKEYTILPPLTPLQYIWIGAPIILFFFWGAIGSIIGGAAIFSNSILMRKIKNTTARYIYTGATTFIAFIFLFRVIFWITPYIEEMMLKSEHSLKYDTVQNQDPEYFLTRTVWKTQRGLDSLGRQVINENHSFFAARQFYNSNGKYILYLNNGAKVDGTWIFKPSDSTIEINDAQGKTIFKLLEITEHRFSFLFNGVKIIAVDD